MPLPRRSPYRWLASLGFAVLALSVTADPLPAYRVEPDRTSVSGISSGGYMAVQFAIAHSATVAGVGVFAGGPFECADSIDSALTTCMQGRPDPEHSVERTRRRATDGLIDPPQNIARQRIWLFSGYNDGVVKQPVMDALYTYYLAFAQADRIYYQDTLGAGHALVTEVYGEACSTTAEPYLNDCDYDGAGLLLQHIYGGLEPPAARPDPAHLLSFEQAEFVPAPAPHRVSMGRMGYVYVPADCAAGQPCRVHVAFHGCRQSANAVDDAFYGHAGYNRWAETNRIIVLYPQATASQVGPFNPKGCWDWWGYNGPDFATRQGPQIRAVRAMLRRLAEGAEQPAPGATEPTAVTAPGLVVLDAADDAVSLAWSANNPVAGYRLERAAAADGPFQVLAVLAPQRHSFVDSGLASGVTGYYRLVALGEDGQETRSAVREARTRAPAPSCDPYFNDNVTHVRRGRAHAWFGLTFARGSWDYMGFWSLLSETALYRDGDSFQVGVCP